ncbi:MAG: inositol monophosphatase [Xanthomonadaceae bacterium]|nr:inositol monophosphatase [Xanthomonadaceae bacterium]
MHALLNIAVRAARAAGTVITRHMDRIDTLAIESKQRNDFVSEVDRLAEQAVIDTVLKTHPQHGFLGEETGRHGGDEFVWIIDPLDGTTNFLHGFPAFAVSIGIQHKGRIEHGVVYDPVRQELFTATRGAGATLDGKRIRVSSVKSLDGALVGTGFPFLEGQDVDAFMGMLRAVITKTAGVRRAGAASLDLAYVAAGRLDGFWELGLKPWDMAAGTLLIQEAGGIVGGIDGGTEFMESGDIVAGGRKSPARRARTARRAPSGW